MQTQNFTPEKIPKMDDRELFSLCQEFGEQARKWKQKFAGLLPEVNHRRLYERKGFSSIFEFAKKLAGMSEKQVRRALNLEEKLKKTPILENLFTSGEISMNKLDRVASIATAENQEFLAEKVQILSKSALETFVRDERNAIKNEADNLHGETGTTCGQSKNHNGLQKPLFQDKSVPGHTQNVQTTNLFEDVKLLEKFSTELKTKLKELIEKGLNINEILLELLQKRDQEIAAEKEKIAQEELQEQAQKQEELQKENELRALIGFPLKKTSRYLKVKIKNILKEEFGEKCSIQGCNSPAATIHHTQRFALSQNNDPRYMAPFCEQHHKIAHSIDQKYQKKRA